MHPSPLPSSDDHSCVILAPPPPTPISRITTQDSISPSHPPIESQNSHTQKALPMDEYTSTYPTSLSFDPAYKSFFESFYALSDDPSAHDRYVENFTEDAVLVMASRTAKGSDEILALRKGLWEKVSSRKHVAVKVFPFGDDADEVMLYGTVKYEMKAGGEKVVDWAARACLVKEDGKVKMRFYQVYLDTGAQ